MIDINELAAMADDIREALDRYNQFGTWMRNGFDPEDGDPYNRREHSYREDLETLAKAFADEHDERKKCGER